MSLRLLTALAAVLVLAACGGSDPAEAPEPEPGLGARLIQADPANRGKSLTIGSKNFTESILLANIYGQALAAGGYGVKYDLDLGLEGVTTRAMRSGRIDAYPEYTGTALTVLLGVPTDKVPKDETAAYEEARKRYAEKYGFVALPQTPFTDSNAVGLTAERARELGNPKTISDLARDHNGRLSLAASAECFKRPDCALGLEKVYGLKFSEQIPIDVADRHEVILEGKADLSIPFTTDGQIAANDEVILEDDKDLFPPYNVTFVLTKEAAERLGPNAQEIVVGVQRGLTTPVMQELNSRVDLDGQKAEIVARQYLQAEGFVR